MLKIFGASVKCVCWYAKIQSESLVSYWNLLAITNFSKSKPRCDVFCQLNCKKQAKNENLNHVLKNGQIKSSSN